MNIRSISSGISIYLILGLILGLIIGDPTGSSGPISMIALGMMMALSMSDISLDRRGVSEDLRQGLAPIAMCFGILTPVFLLASLFFEGDFRTGWIMAAVVPAGIMIIPYASRLKADVRLALYGELAIYISALLITPVIAIATLGRSVDISQLFCILLILILIPLGLSRIIIKIKAKARMKAMVMNFTILFFFTIVVGANRAVFFEELDLVLALAVTSFLSIFGVGLVIDHLLKGTASGQRKVLTMFATIKNTGLAIAICLTLFPPQAAMPPTMLVIFEMIWIIFLISWKYRV